MGKCFSVCRSDEPTTDDGNSGFQENERNKPRDWRAAGQSGDASRDSLSEDEDAAERQFPGRRRRRKSSGLSRYSGDGRHVIEKPFSIAAFNVKRYLVVFRFEVLLSHFIYCLNLKHTKWEQKIPSFSAVPLLSCHIRDTLHGYPTVHD